MTYSPKTLLIPAFLVGVLAAGPAFADCAQDIEAVKTVAPTVELSDDDKATVNSAHRSSRCQASRRR